MKATELIAKLQKLVEEHGDLEIKREKEYDSTYGSLYVKIHCIGYHNLKKFLYID